MAKQIKIDVDKALAIYKSKNNEKLTRKKLIDKIGGTFNYTTLSNWERGDVPKGFNTVFKIAEICDCDVKDIIEIKDY